LQAIIRVIMRAGIWARVGGASRPEVPAKSASALHGSARQAQGALASAGDGVTARQGKDARRGRQRVKGLACHGDDARTGGLRLGISARAC
jgi:hypothetical protein